MKKIVSVLIILYISVGIYAKNLKDVMGNEISELFPSISSVTFIYQDGMCAEIAIFYALHFSNKKLSFNNIISEIRDKYGEPLYSAYTIKCFLEDNGINSNIIRIKNINDLFKYKTFNSFIIYFQQNNYKLGHFSYCRKTDDNNYKIYDPFIEDTVNSSDLERIIRQFINWQGILILID